MDLVIFEENKPLVLEGLGNGDFDYMEAASEVFEADFFRFIKARAYLDPLAETYPTPRKKEEVPFWFYVASNLSMRLHGVHAFDAFPMVVRAGGMLQAFGPKAGRKVVHPETNETTVDLTHFTSRAFSMVVNQVIFIMLAYDLLQIYLLHQGRKELNQKTLPRIRQQLLPSDNYIIVYWQNYYGLFSPFELIGFVVMLGEEARKKIAAKPVCVQRTGRCRRIGRELNELMQNPRPP